MIIIKMYNNIPITAYGAENRQYYRTASAEMIRWFFLEALGKTRVDREMNEEVREQLNAKMENNIIWWLKSVKEWETYVYKNDARKRRRKQTERDIDD